MSGYVPIEVARRVKDQALIAGTLIGFVAGAAVTYFLVQ